MKKYVRKIKKNVKPIYALPVVLVLIVVAFIAIFSGGDEGDRSATTPSSTSRGKDGGKAKRRSPKPAPIGSSGVIDEARRVGPLVVAQARGTIRNPSRVRLRISAAPKQKVSVDWQLSCFRDRRIRVGKGKYRAKTPDTRAISVPLAGAETCIATAGAQLTRDGKGRVKVAVIAG